MIAAMALRMRAGSSPEPQRPPTKPAMPHMARWLDHSIQARKPSATNASTCSAAAFLEGRLREPKQACPLYRHHGLPGRRRASDDDARFGAGCAARLGRRGEDRLLPVGRLLLQTHAAAEREGHLRSGA